MNKAMPGTQRFALADKSVRFEHADDMADQ